MTERAQQPILHLKKVVKAYPSGEGQFLALNQIDLQINQGEFLGVTGKSGAGKTTLLNMISGISPLTSGEVLFYENGNPTAISVHLLNEDQLALWRGQNIGIVYQSFELLPALNLIKNVMLPPDFSGRYQPLASKQRALDLLASVDILEHAHKTPDQISGGQKQRVAIARALINDPPVILADEPTGNLDSVTAENILQIFERLVERGKTVVMVTHDESLAARFTRRLHIVDGELDSPPAPRQRLGSTSTSPNPAPVPKTTANPSPHRPPALEPPGLQRSHPQHPHPAIVLRGVQKIYENAAGKFVALKPIDLTLDYGQFISIVGKSGSGKSTLINMISGIDFPTAGQVLVGGEQIYRMTESQRALWRGRHIGVVFQFFQLLPTLTLLENTMLPMDFCSVHPIVERPQRAMHLLERVGLGAQAHQLPTAVSSGAQQSAAIARALATNPSIILADEPTGNLDSRAADNILTLFEELAAAGKTILIVTHDPSITQRTDQTVTLSDGAIIDPAAALPHPPLKTPPKGNPIVENQNPA